MGSKTLYQQQNGKCGLFIQWYIILLLHAVNMSESQKLHADRKTPDIKE